MKKRLALPLALLAVFGLMAAFASTAQAHPSYAGRCSDCHSGTNVPVAAILAYTVGTTATYNVNAPGATAIAVFDGTTKVGTPIIGTSGSFAVTVGKTYTVFSVKGPSTNTGLGTTSVSPAALPPADKTAPTTTSDAVASYTNSATIHLIPTDNIGGSGVAHTYYILDSLPQAEGLTVSTSVLGAHTLQFWSVDTAGNIETPHKTAAFVVTVPVPDTTAPTTTSDAVASYTNSATIHLFPTDNIGGSGVAHTYYILDSDPQAEGVTVSTSGIGAHTLQFWSVDNSGNIETPANNASFEVTASATPPVSVHRFYNRRQHSYFYTSNEGEKERVIEHLSDTYSYEGVAYTINADSPYNQSPLYRFYNRGNGSYFYTASETEKNDLAEEMSDTYTYDGQAYSVSKTPVPGSTTVYRFYNRRNGNHFYTADVGEKNRVLSALSGTYVLEGPAFYLAP
jgi:hypothetical protein